MSFISNIKSSTHFCHYTDMNTAKKIIETKSLLLSKYDSMNDQFEIDLHKDEKDKVYSISFCNSEARNIPMSYLYAGIDGKGCRLEFTDASIRRLISKGVVCHVSYDINGKPVVDKEHEYNEDEYEIYADWIYYISKDGFGNYKGDNIQLASCYEEFCDENRGSMRYYFIKNRIWMYEKEFRIVIRFKNNNPDDRIAIMFDIGKNERGISIQCAPEIDETEYKGISKAFSDMGIHKVSFYNDSAIKMNLVKRNMNLYNKIQ